jgi:hypothetical protein
MCTFFQGMSGVLGQMMGLDSALSERLASLAGAVITVAQPAGSGASTALFVELASTVTTSLWI